MSNDHHLFLIEFLVDQVNVPCIRAINQDILPSTTFVSFQILNLRTINIYQDDASSGCSCVEDEMQVFRKGKSCLFALPASVLEKPLHSFPVIMSVNKKLPPGVLPDVMLIGSHQIELKNLINLIVKEYVFQNGNACKSMKDTFKITTATGQLVGNATVYIRASCFGKKIITQFQIPHNKKPYLFKGSEDCAIFACKKIPSDVKLSPCEEPKKSLKNLNPCVCNNVKSVAYGNGTLKNCFLYPPPPPPTPSGFFDPYQMLPHTSYPTASSSHKRAINSKKCGCT